MASDTRARLLETTFRLVQEKGFHGTSLNDILAESGGPRGSLYYHFPGGKEELIRESMLQAANRITQFLKDIFVEGCDPAIGVHAYIEAAAEELRDSDFVFGCPVAPVVLDLAKGSSSLQEACQKVLEEWQHILAGGLMSAGMERQRADALAIMVVSAVEGALILARAQRDTSPLEVVAEELVLMIHHAIPHHPEPTVPGA